MPSQGETFGMVTIEAMAAGVPIVGTNRDGTREILGEGRLGYLFERDDVAGFCRQIGEVRSGKGLAEKTEAAREAALTAYSKDRMLASINELLLEMTEEPIAGA